VSSAAALVSGSLESLASFDALSPVERIQGRKETLDGTNNACERAIGWWIKERYRTMRGYNVPENAVRVSRLLAWCGNFLTTEDGATLPGFLQ
jgi:hypothetical protein